MSIYKENPLDHTKKEIRLLRLQPSSNIDAEICGTLFSASLDDPTTNFEALSYTWGVSSEGRTIVLNGHAGRLATDNLYYALRRLRKTRVERIVWIDAICINQDDIDEKAFQVALMGKVYTRAARVLIWIGESEKKALAEPGLVGSVKVKYWKLHNQMNPLMFPHRAHHFVEAIRRTRPHWWERAWVVQEAACAKHITAIFGPCQMRWYSFYMLLFGVQDDCLYQHKADQEKLARAKVTVEEIRTIERLHQGKKKRRMTATELMWRARYSQATIAHDKVYALLAMMPQGGAEFVTPDYRETVSETFAKATFAIIRTDGILDVLGCVSLGNAPGVSRVKPGEETEVEIWRNSRRQNSSWVVDFANVKYSLFDTPAHILLQNVWSTTTTRATHARYLGGGKLQLHGYSIDVIDSLVHLQESGKSPSTVDQESLCELFSRASTLAAQSDPMSLFQLHNRKIGQKNEKGKQNLVSKEGFQHMLKQQQMRDPSIDYFARGLFLWEEIAGCPPTYPSRYETSYSITKSWWYGHLEAYGCITAGKASFFNTSSGLIGVAPAGFQERDVVVILDGARLPIVLHPNEGLEDGGTFTFRGYAYVHGLMDQAGSRNWYLRELRDDQRVKRRGQFTLS